MRVLGSILAVIVVVSLATCGYSTTSPSTGNNNPSGGNQSGGHTSNITVNSNLTFGPSVDTVAVNTTVTWTWPTGNTVGHNVTFQDGPASPTQATGTYQRTFDTAGTYPYRCTIHSSGFAPGDGMVGVIVVQ